MNKPAAITAELVDVRNVGMHKCIKLTLHVPAERAAEVIAAFGWATAVDPVPVALARLTNEAEPREPVGEAHREAAARKPSADHNPSPPASNRYQEGFVHGHRKGMADCETPRRPIAPDKRLTQRAGILCNDPDFQLWLKKTNPAWGIMNWPKGTDAERAAHLVRNYCGVTTRKDIIPGTPAAMHFDEMLGKYEAWQACLEEVS